MSLEDARLALIQHATSKIGVLEDLFNIRTLSFRGEAIDSISSVSETTIINTKEDISDAVEVTYENGEIKESISARSIKGSIISIHNLFKNIPARKKFLKSEQTEKKHIYDTFLNIAIPFLNIHFELYSDNKLIYRLSSTEDIKTRIYEVYGKEFTEHSNKYNAEVNNMSITGVLGDTHIGSKNSKIQMVYINNRAFKSPLINVAVSKGYEGNIHRDLKPSFVLFINIDPKEVDVNIHPRKLEVKFKDEKLIFSTIYNFVSKNLERQSKDFIDSLREIRDFHHQCLKFKKGLILLEI